MKNLIYLLLPLIGWPPEVAAQRLTRAACVAYGLDHNVTLQSRRLDEGVARYATLETKARMLPQVTGSAAFDDNLKLAVQLVPAELFGGPPGTFNALKFGTTFNFSGTVQMDQLLFDRSFLIGLRINQRNEILTNQVTQQQRETVIYAVSRAFYSAWVSVKQVDILSTNLKTTRELLRTTTLQYQQGSVREVEMTRIQVTLNNQLASIRRGERAARTALNQLKFEMGMPLANLLTLEEAPLTDVPQLVLDVDTTDQSHARNRTEYRQLDIQTGLRQLDIQRQRAGYVPTLTAFLKYTEQALRPRFNFLDGNQPWFASSALGFRLSIPIFDGFQKQHRIQQARLQLDKSRLDLDRLTQNIDLDVANALFNFTNALQSLTQETDNVRLAQSVYQNASLEYQQGSGPYTTFVDAENQLTAAQSNQIESLLAVYLAKVDLAKAQGKLTTLTY